MNRKGKATISLVLIAAVVVLLSYISVCGIGEDQSFSAASIKRGLDLEGGVSITYQTVKENPTAEEMADTRFKLQQRVDNYSTEAAVYLEGTNRINVDIPGANDAETILKELGQAGSIYFFYGEGNLGFDYETYSFVLNDTIENLIAKDQLIITGVDIKDAWAGTQDGENGIGKEYIVCMELNDEGAEKFKYATSISVGKQIAIVYDGEVISAPSVTGTIDTGKVYITGMENFEAANNLATIIRIGALPLELTELRSTVVGAQLGAEAISTSLFAGAIGFVCVLLFMAIYYRVPGIAAGIALIIYIGLNVIVLNIFDVTLTLQGIAGILLSIGMAVDANVIIFQRIREELATGKTVRSAMKLGFHKAMSAIVDGNVTTLIAAFVLYFLGSGGVKGFAITLAIGIVLSMFTALYVTKFILQALYDVGFDHEKFYGIQKERKILPFIKYGKKFMMISAAVILSGFVGMGVFAATGHGALNFGLDFKGGTSYSVTFPEEFTESLNRDLEKLVLGTIGETAEIVKVTGENTYIIKTAELSQEERVLLEDKLVETYAVDRNQIESENISGKVSGEMRSAAIKAVLVATLCMLVYIWIRFKNLNFAVSAVSALLHDVLVVLAVYSLGRISVGNNFIACMLTIVGYSINATIVIFDRIREEMAQQEEGTDLAAIVDKSVTETLSRSVNSSLTTLVMVVMLVIFGVESIREFAIPLMVGIIAGGYSSVCLTGAIWHTLQKKFPPKVKEKEEELP